MTLLVNNSQLLRSFLAIVLVSVSKAEISEKEVCGGGSPKKVETFLFCLSSKKLHPPLSFPFSLSLCLHLSVVKAKVSWTAKSSHNNRSMTIETNKGQINKV